MMVPQLPPLVVCTFLGGFLDGKVMRSDHESENDILNASRVYYGTRGIVGSAIRGLSDAGVQALLEETYPGEAHDRGFSVRHVYTITESVMDDDGTMNLVLNYKLD